MVAELGFPMAEVSSCCAVWAQTVRTADLPEAKLKNFLWWVCSQSQKDSLSDLTKVL